MQTSDLRVNIGAVKRREFCDALSSRVQILGFTVFEPMIWISAVIKVPIDSRLRSEPLAVPVRINASDYWDKILPTIWVSFTYPWLKPNIDWHMYSDRKICYELGDRWIDQFEKLHESKIDNLPDLAAQWITNAAAHVLHVQYTCHALGIQKWPEEIAPSWPHGKPAIELYQREKLTKGKKSR